MDIDYRLKILHQMELNGGNALSTPYSELTDTRCDIASEVQRRRQQWKARRQRGAPSMFTINFNLTINTSSYSIFLKNTFITNILNI